MYLLFSDDAKEFDEQCKEFGSECENRGHDPIV